MKKITLGLTKPIFLLLFTFSFTNSIEAQWTPIVSNTGDLLWDVHFPTDLIGYAVGRNSTILKTTDGGKTWTPQIGITDTHYYGVYFKDELNGFAVGRRASQADNGYFHYTTDGGATWYGKALGFTDLLWNSIAFSELDLNDNQYGIMVGQEGQIAYSPDGGESWFKRTSPTGLLGQVTDIAFMDGLNAIAVGYTSTSVGFIIKTTDGGNSWKSVITNASSRLLSVSFYKNEFEDRWEGLAVGGNGVIYKTTDGGENWEEQLPVGVNALNSVYFYNLDYALIAGNSGEIYVSNNGGLDWTIEDSGTTWNLNSVYINANSSATAVGSLGTIVKQSCADVGGTLKFIDNTAAPFISPKLYATSKAYFYYNVEENEFTPPLCAVVEQNVLMSGGNILTLGVKYLGNGLAQFWIDFSETYVTDPNYTIVLPNQLSEAGITINLENLPPSFNINLNPLDSSYSTQNIGIFAGRSSGDNIIKQKNYVAGSAWTEATISLSGSLGMRLNLERDLAGNEKVTRSFEFGPNLSAKFPPAYQLKEKIEGAKSTSIKIRGQVGQSMTFSSTNGELDDTSRKAKTALLLETFGIGAVPMSPVAGVVIVALEKSLELLNPDIPSLYSDNYQNSIRYGVAVQGDLSLGYNFNFDNTGLEILNGTNSTLSLGYSYLNTTLLKTGDVEAQHSLAGSFNINSLDLGIGEKVDFGNAWANKYGVGVSITSSKDANDNLKSMKLSLETTKEEQILITQKTNTEIYDFVIPQNVIDNNYNSDNWIGSAAAMLTNGKSNYPLKLGVDYFMQDLQNIYQFNPNVLGKFEDHNLLETKKAETIGISEKGVTESIFKFLKAGKGRLLGIELSYSQKEEYLHKQEIVVNDTILPTFENIKKGHNDYQLVGDIIDLIEGTILLIQGALEELVIVFEQVFEDGKDFLIESADQTVELFGNIVSDGTKWVLVQLDPSYDTTINNSSRLSSEIKHAYVSRTFNSAKSTSFSSGITSGEQTLYIISDDINVNLLDINDNPIETFDPVTLSLTIDQAKVDELEFTDTEKALAKMYFFDDVNLIWEEVVGDANTDINIVETQITKAGNYAIGIAYDSATMDNTAPEIQDHYPKEGNIIPPIDEYWAQVYESVIGAGIDLSQTIVKVDDIEVAVLWDPVNDRLLYTPETPLADGEHTFEVIAKDLNGNTSSIFSNFTVDSTILGVEPIADINAFKVFPNPAQNLLHIKGNHSKLTSVNLYDILGQHVMSIANGFETINISNLPPAIYFVKLSSVEGERVIKIIKK